MTIVSQLEASSSRHPRIPSSPKLPLWVNRFAFPQPGQPPVVVESSIVEFTDQEELEYVIDNRPWNVQGQIFHLEMWTTFFCDVEMISNHRVWVCISRLSVQYWDAEILEVIMQLVGTFIRTDENSLLGLNGLFVRVLLEMDLRLPLKRVMIINDEDEKPVLLSFEKLFEVCFYGGQMRSEGHICLAIEDKDGWLLVDKLFDDELMVYSTGAVISGETSQELHWGGYACLFSTGAWGGCKFER
ncbi:hypothetical protein ACFX10_019530 [Malus domestica]